MTLKQDLKAVAREFKALEKKMEKLIAAVEKNEKSRAGKKAAAKSVKAKPAKKAPAKKAPAKKKAAKLTATDQVLKILKGRKKGVDASTLVKRTGFDLKKIRNILHRNYKLGRIKRVGKGMYVGA